MLGWWLDLVIVEVFSKLNDSVILVKKLSTGRTGRGRHCEVNWTGVRWGGYVSAPLCCGKRALAWRVCWLLARVPRGVWAQRGDVTAAQTLSMLVWLLQLCRGGWLPPERASASSLVQQPDVGGCPGGAAPRREASWGRAARRPLAGMAVSGLLVAGVWVPDSQRFCWKWGNSETRGELVTGCHGEVLLPGTQAELVSCVPILCLLQAKKVWDPMGSARSPL